MAMSEPRITYFEDEDVLHLALSDEREAESVELSVNVTAELNAAGELIGIEILDARNYLRDTILDTAQARMLQLQRSG
jgi:uncharacterized protein YuzE